MLLDVRSVAAQMDVSVRKVWQLVSSGGMPAPIRIGRAVRWRESDVNKWIEMGCPSRDVFDAAQAGGQRHECLD